ncbi:receptor-like protein kinase FERONIA [Rutidosis leptorrhynchoides]|uniref:receptor-like protein kinase FERONIA n=1 Tax=Rutidosis leptorrhynchoides TaxID=125765 RepID=UPI003A9A5254
MEDVIKELHKALKCQGETTILSRFQHGDIVRATEDFSDKCRVGLDTYNTVYKAELDQFESKSSCSISKRIAVAIKVISSRKHGQEKKDFHAEIEERTSYKHPNIASLLGFCDTGPEMMLVYEHGSNESLNDYLRSNHNTRNKLTWKVRLQICLEIARGLNHLHTRMDSKKKVIHGDIKSANILLVKKSETVLEAKIAYFGLLKLHPKDQDASIDTKVYWDPEYERTGKLEIESDIYAFGVVLFEIFCGRLAYDSDYNTAKNDKGLAPIAYRRFREGTIKEMMDPMLSEEETDVFSTNKGPNQDSLDTFLDISFECLRQTQSKRPQMKTVIKELEKALDFQENLMNNLQISLEDIEFATQNFSQKNCVGEGRDWKAYKGQLPHANAAAGVVADVNASTAIVAKRWNSKSGEGDRQFRTELDILLNRKHENIIGLVGYCNKMNETIIVYQDVPNSSLDMYLSDASLTWMKRLDICIAIATGLEFFHKGDVTLLKKVTLGDIKSSSILLNVVNWKAASKVETKTKDDWKAKISIMEMSSLDSLQFNVEHINDGTYAYLDPESAKQGSLTSVIYSFGVILFEILRGRLAWTNGYLDHSVSLVSLVKRHYEEETLSVMVFEGLKKQILLRSFTTFADIAYRCLCDDVNLRPEATEVVNQLKKAI